MKFKIKNVNWEKTTFIFVFITLVGSTIYSLIRLILAPKVALPGTLYVNVKSDYALMLAQCVLGIFVMFLPSMIERRLRIDIPKFMHIVFVFFLYAAIYLGEIRSFYYKIPHWDTILHTFSGAMLGALGFSIVSLLNDIDKVKINLSPLFVAVFAFCFALSLGVLWEVYEFTIDGLLATNMQKYALENSTPLIGRYALADTMKDLIVDALGAFTISTVGFISIKYKTGWIEKIQIRRFARQENKEKFFSN